MPTMPVSTRLTDVPIRLASDCLSLDSAMCVRGAGIAPKGSPSLLQRREQAVPPFVTHRASAKDPDINQVPGRVDVCTAGFLCQPLSSAGLRLGKRDKRGRENVFEHVLAYSMTQKPMSFIWTKVRGLARSAHKIVLYDVWRPVGTYLLGELANFEHGGLRQSPERAFASPSVGYFRRSPIRTSSSGQYIGRPGQSH